MNMDRFELAASDDTALLPKHTASIVAPEDGKYVILIRKAHIQAMAAVAIDCT